MRLKIPPPLVALTLAALLWQVAACWPVPAGMALPREARLIGAVLAGGVGLALDLVGVAAFVRARTTVNPMRPQNTRALVQTGLYARSRNPMYVGQALMLAGWAGWLGHPAGVLALVALVAWLNRFQIAPEERWLRERFGAEFDRYCERVPRWL